MDRRTFLALGLAWLAAAGCTSDDGPALPWVDPDEALRAEVVASEGSLIAAYRATIAAHPELAAQLEPLAVQHEQHLARVDPRAVSTRPSPTGTTAADAPSAGGSTLGESPTGAGATGVPTATPSPTGSKVPAHPRRALAALATAASAAYKQRMAACDSSHSSDLAGDLCLIAASESQHAAWLSELAAEMDEE
ncbi:MAG: hypothetical protein WCF04_02990 [Candidatus Nanopelagicales bacterium]